MNREKTAPHQLLEQQRSTLAWNLIREEVKGKDFEKKYRAWVERLPAMIMTNGLGQTLAFLRSKPGEMEKKTLYEHISEWLLSNKAPINWVNSKGEKLHEGELMERIQETTGVVYLQATQEALRFTIWLKRYAGAMLKKE